MKLDFIGIASSRAGTTWLANCLSEHPDICFSKDKEVRFFNKEHNFKKGYAFYETFFEHCPKESVKGEFTSAYFLDPTIALKIKEAYPGVKLIAVLRNPVERAYSHYGYTKKKIGSQKPFKDVIKDHASPVIDQGFYGKHLEPFIKEFGLEQMHVIVYEEMTSNPQNTLKKLYEFLGVDSSFNAPSLLTHPNSTARTNYRFVWLNRLIEKRKQLKQSKVGRGLIWIFNVTGLKVVVKWVAAKNRELGTNKEIAIKDELQDVRRELENLYQDDKRKLETLLGRNLSVWGF